MKGKPVGTLCVLGGTVKDDRRKYGYICVNLKLFMTVEVYNNDYFLKNTLILYKLLGLSY